ncbi:MAG: hypothetical protein K9J30_09805, partial [Bacteroidales bacterium]|nr:hypothetical protein [Bacteroidales bacterium]
NRFTDSSIQGYFGSRILSLAVNTNGELYAAGDGVIYFNGIDWYRYTNQGAGYITIDHENNTWVGCGDYICKLKNNTWQYYQLNHNPGISNFIISACDFDSENTAWVGTLYHGLFKIENDTVVQIDEFSFGQINSLKVQEDKIFIATRDRGLLEYIPGESKLIKYNTTNSDITGNWVQYAYPDHDSIWLIGGDLMLLKDGDFTFYMDKDSTLFTT